MAGIIAGIQLAIPISFWYVFICGILAILIVSIPAIRSTYHLRSISGLVFSLFFISAGYLLSTERIHELRSFSPPDDARFIAYLEKAPQEKENSVKLIAHIEAVNYEESWYAENDKVVLYLEKDSAALALLPGDRISFLPDFQDIENTGNPDAFNYSRYMAFHLIARQSYLQSSRWQKLQNAEAKGIKTFFMRFRQKLLKTYRKAGLSGREYAVAAALTLGYKDALTNRLRQAYSSSGAMHILAVSGLHVGVIYLILQSLLFFMTGKRSLRLARALLIILFIWGYASLTGMSPSVTRAAIMFSFISLGGAMNRHINIYNILAASAFFTLLFNPFALTELGFWLSYAAVISIVSLFPHIYKLIRCRTWLGDKAWSLIAVSVAAQVGTAPIAILFFHQFSNYFILTNLLVIPVVSFVVYLAIAVFAFSVLPGVSAFLAGLLKWLIQGLNSVVFWIESLPGATSTGIYINVFQMICIYVILISIAVFFIHRRKNMIFAILGSLILFLSVSAWHRYNVNQQKQLIVYHIPDYTAVNCITGRDHVLFSDMDIPEEKISDKLQSHWLKKGLEKETLIPVQRMTDQYILTNLLQIDNPYVFQKSKYISFAGIRLIMVQDNEIMRYQTDETLELDYIIVGNNAIHNISSLSEYYDYRAIIFDSSNESWYLDKMQEALKDTGIDYHMVSQSGAFVQAL